MQGEQVILTDMLLCRERRAQIQDTFLSQYHCPVISFCMNIPGPVKTNEKIRAAFENGKTALLTRLEQSSAEIKNFLEIHEKTGDELLLAVDYPAQDIKDLTTEIEETHPDGRLFDIDVIRHRRSGNFQEILIGSVSSAAARRRSVPAPESTAWKRCRQRLKKC